LSASNAASAHIQALKNAASQNQPLPKRRETFVLFRAIRWTRVALHVAVGLLIVGTIFPRAGAAKRAWFVRWWSAKLLRILRIVLDVHGARPEWLESNLVIAANHISWLDIFVINAVRPTRFVAKSEIRDWPIVGWLCQGSGTIFIARAKRSDTAKINTVIHDVLGYGDCVGLFPEGTTSPGDIIRKFHSSLFEPAVINKATVAPVALAYRYDDGSRSFDPAYILDLTFSQSLDKIIRQPMLIAEITFAPRIDAGGLTRRTLASRSESAIAAILNVPVSKEKLSLSGGELSVRTETFEEN
jgi:1-acyl-sn-glycerol-3-phosphate acyltransferase